MSERYYPYVPWDDQNIYSDVINHDRIRADLLSREGIFGPLAQVLKLLRAGDLRYLKAQDNLRLAVLEDVIT